MSAPSSCSPGRSLLHYFSRVLPLPLVLLQAIGASPAGIPAATKTPGGGGGSWRGGATIATPSALRPPPAAAAAAATTPGSEAISSGNELANAMRARQVRQAATAAAAAGDREDATLLPQ